MAAWPGGLPRPRLEGFDEQLGKAYVEASSDKVGVDRRRAVTTAAPDRLTFNLSCTKAQWATIQNFYRTTTRRGVDRFDYPHPITLTTVRALFADQPRLVPNTRTPKFIVSIQLKIWA
ncbi:hypothetical protein sos41_11920 [Alphaproteobacteria bacterium SO-S41]|nr:hypothetical protein sos41_11920 [Alphaproteobacteria bacterium SO-S41]